MSFEYSGATSPMMTMVSLEDNEVTAESRVQSLAQDITSEIHLMRLVVAHSAGMLTLSVFYLTV